MPLTQTIRGTATSVAGTASEIVSPENEADIVAQTAFVKMALTTATTFLAGVTLGTVLSRLIGRRKPVTASSPEV
jgi:hypothetical protein